MIPSSPSIAHRTTVYSLLFLASVSANVTSCTRDRTIATGLLFYVPFHILDNRQKEEEAKIRKKNYHMQQQTVVARANKPPLPFTWFGCSSLTHRVNYASYVMCSAVVKCMIVGWGPGEKAFRNTFSQSGFQFLR